MSRYSFTVRYISPYTEEPVELAFDTPGRALLAHRLLRDWFMVDSTLSPTDRRW